jgi:hypothetical protein
MSEYEEKILAEFSTAGLKRNALNRAGKKMHLWGLRDRVTGRRLPPEEIEAILDGLYGSEPKAAPGEAQAEVLRVIETNSQIARRVLDDWMAKRWSKVRAALDRLPPPAE